MKNLDTLATMQASVEISMYPLRRDYGTPILQFIDRLKRHPELQVQVNTISTQVFGPYDKLMAALSQEMKTAFERDGETVMVLKILNIDLRP